MDKSQLLADLAKVVGGAKTALSESGDEAKQHLRSSLTNLLQNADVATKSELEAMRQSLKQQAAQIARLEKRLAWLQKQSTTK